MKKTLCRRCCVCALARSDGWRLRIKLKTEIGKLKTN